MKKKFSLLVVFHMFTREKWHKHSLPQSSEKVSTLCSLIFLRFKKEFSWTYQHFYTERSGYVRVLCSQWVFFVRYPMQMVSGSDHLQYLTTSMHQMTVWLFEQSHP